MAAYSMDLRTRVLRDAEAGRPSKELAEKYSVSRAWVDRLKQRRRETGEIAPRPQTKFRGRTLDPHQEQRLVALISARPDATLVELREALPTTAGVSTLWRAIDRLGLTVKKTVHADEQRRPDVAAARRRWQDGLPVRDARQYVFLDESGVTTDLLRRYGRSPRGLRLRDYTPLSHWQTHTIVAALRLDGLHAPAVFDGPMDTATFLAYVEQVLVPPYGPAMSSCWIIWRSTNTRTSTRRLPARGHSCDFCPRTVLTSLPSSSRLRKLKAFLRAARPRTFDHVVELVGRALGLFTPQECANFIRHCGYRVATGL